MKTRKVFWQEASFPLGSCKSASGAALLQELAPRPPPDSLPVSGLSPSAAQAAAGHGHPHPAEAALSRPARELLLGGPCPFCLVGDTPVAASYTADLVENWAATSELASGSTNLRKRVKDRCLDE